MGLHGLQAAGRGGGGQGFGQQPEEVPPSEAPLQPKIPSATAQSGAPSLQAPHLCEIEPEQTRHSPLTLRPPPPPLTCVNLSHSTKTSPITRSRLLAEAMSAMPARSTRRSRKADHACGGTAKKGVGM